MKYPLVSDLAASGIPVAVTCRVLEIARQPYYRWLAHPITEAELVEAYRLNALIDAHHDDPEFGYRYLADEAADAGVPMATRTAWRLCSTQGLSSSISTRKKGNGTRPGPPVHDDLVQRQFSSVTEVNTVWFTDITEHHTSQGKLYCCAIKDACSRRIVGYAIDARMKASLAVRALTNAVANRHRAGAEVAGCVVHSDRGSQAVFNWSSQHLLHGGVRWESERSRRGSRPTEVRLFPQGDRLWRGEKIECGSGKLSRPARRLEKPEKRRGFQSR